MENLFSSDMEAGDSMAIKLKSAWLVLLEGAEKIREMSADSLPDSEIGKIHKEISDSILKAEDRRILELGKFEDWNRNLGRL